MSPSLRIKDLVPSLVLLEGSEIFKKCDLMGGLLVIKDVLLKVTLPLLHCDEEYNFSLLCGPCMMSCLNRPKRPWTIPQNCEPKSAFPLVKLIIPGTLMHCWKADKHKVTKSGVESPSGGNLQLTAGGGKEQPHGGTCRVHKGP